MSAEATTQRTRSPPPASALGFGQRLALLTCALNRDGAAELLQGLAAPTRALALEFMQTALGWDSPTRQAFVSAEFGVHPEAGERLRALMAEAPAALRGDIFRRLPSYHRTLFPGQGRGAAPLALAPSPMLAAFADRLVREATR